MTIDKVHALAIVAHPDDESFLLAGTTLKFEEEGKEVAIVCATRGDKGADRLGRDLTPLQMAKLRTAELLSACGVLHCECKQFFDYPDGSLDSVNFDELVSNMLKQIEQHQPQIILTFGPEGVSGHRDHITVGKAVMAACKLANPKPSEVWLASIPSSLAENFHQHMEQRKIHHLHFIKNQLQGVPDERLTRIDVSKYKETKIKALESHRSQYLPHLTWPNFLKEECFEIIKLP
jgi:N-acetylglucosamine malate deacetylase 2